MKVMGRTYDAKGRTVYRQNSAPAGTSAATRAKPAPAAGRWGLDRKVAMRDHSTWGPTVFFLEMALCGTLIALVTDGVESIGRGWLATPCVVESSRPGQYSGGRGHNRRFYRLDVVYAYQHDGADFHGRYSDSFEAPEELNAMLADVDAHSAGTRMVCYVDPANAADSVLDPAPPALCPMFTGLGVTLLAAVAARLLVQSIRSADRTRRNRFHTQSS
jgi:hypothetical protein